MVKYRFWRIQPDSKRLSFPDFNGYAQAIQKLDWLEK